MKRAMLLARPLPHPAIAAIVALTLIGLALRIFAARGGLWLDEAWSAVFARDAGGAAAVLFELHHDNNHHLNTIWMQAIGWGGSPLAMRAPAIICGTITVPLVAWIALPRGNVAAIAAAMFFALSPMLVTYGAEARGYAPMLLALLAATGLVDRWLDASPEELPMPRAALATCFALGALMQLTIVFGLAAVAGWVFWRRNALWPVVQLLAPSVLAVAAVVALTLAGDFEIGSYAPFGGRAWYEALADMLRFTFGVPAAFKYALPPLVALAVGIAAMQARMRGRSAFFVLAIIAFPLAMAALAIGNSGIPRYYLLSAAALLLLAAESLAARPRLAAALLAPFAIGALAMDIDLIGNRRGDPAPAIAAMVARTPMGAAIAVEHWRDTAVIEAAAATAGYRVHLVTDPCPATPFLFVSRNGTEPFAPSPVRCGARYRAIAGARTTGLSGNHWRLYLRAR